MWRLGRLLGTAGLAGLLLALALQNAYVHEFFFHSEVVESDEDIIFFPTISRFVDSPSNSSPSQSPFKASLHSSEVTSTAASSAAPSSSDPSVGCSLSGRRYVRVGIHGCIYEEEEGDYFNQALMRLAGLLAGRYDYADALANPLFRHRVSRFLVDNEGSKRVTVRFPLTNGSFASYPLSRLSASNGHFEDQLVLDVGCRGADGEQLDGGRGVPVIEHQDGLQRIRHSVVSEDNRTFHGHSFIVEDRGISIISDIDDTIKVTGVMNGSILFENTMLNEFAAVKGMSRLYNFWKTKYRGLGHDVQFHYVSGGPWQLYPVLQEFLHSSNADFPEGTWHLNQIFRDFSSFLTFVRSPFVFKVEILKPLIASFPDRKFVLVGDDGQQDPEVYAAIAEAFPDQVLHVFIHHVNNTNEDDGVTSYSVAEPGLQRCQKAFARIPDHKWTLFSDAELDTLDEKEFTL